MLAAAEVLLDPSLDLRAQLLRSGALLRYLADLVPLELLVPHQVHDERRLDVEELRHISVALATMEHSVQDLAQLLTAELMLGTLLTPLERFSDN